MIILSNTCSRWRVKRLTEKLQGNVAGTMVVARALIMIRQTGQYRAGRDCAAFTGPNHAFKFAFKGAQPCDALSDIGELTTGGGVNGGAIGLRCRLERDQITDALYGKTEIAGVTDEGQAFDCVGSVK